MFGACRLDSTFLSYRKHSKENQSALAFSLPGEFQERAPLARGEITQDRCLLYLMGTVKTFHHTEEEETWIDSFRSPQPVKKLKDIELIARFVLTEAQSNRNR